MRKMPLATVIVPSYNSPDIYLTLESILEQDYPRIQLILVDDASDNFALEKIKEFLQLNNRGNLEQSKVLVNAQNRGTVYTLNLALSHSRGEYIFNLAGDDCFYDSQVLSDWIAEFQKTGAQVMTAYRAVYDENLFQFFRTEPMPEQVRKIETKSPQDLFEDIAAANFVFGCCTARTAESIRRYGMFDERYRLIEDHPMNLRLLRMGEPIVFFDRIVVKYRGGGTSSPIRYNAAYAQDVDSIFQYDVLPYTRHPLHMRWQFFQWKRDQRLLQRRARLLIRFEENRGMKYLVQVWYYLHHPWRTLCRVPSRIRKMMKKGS